MKLVKEHSYINDDHLQTFKKLALAGKKITEEKRGLWANIHAKRKRIKAGSGERMRKPGSEGAPTAKNLKDADTTNEEFEQMFENSTPAWTRKEGKNPAGGLNRKGIASYRRENPGSKLSMAVTTKPSKLDPDSKAAKRRKSFCARMSGMRGSMKKPNGEPTRKALALRKWNC